jgi:hypothetical protein
VTIEWTAEGGGGGGGPVFVNFKITNQKTRDCILLSIGSKSVWSLIGIPVSRDISYTVKLGDKELFDKEQIGVKEPFSVTKCQFTS